MLLALLLQIVPVCRVALMNQAIAPNGFAIVLKLAAVGAVLLGGVDAVSGASTYIVGLKNQLSPTSQVTTNANGTNGVAFRYKIVLNPAVSPDPTQDYYNASPLPPGLTISTAVGGNGLITGTPTTVGQTYVTLTAGNVIYDNLGGHPTTTNVWITINAAGGGGGTAPLITTQPVSQTANVGASVTFTVVATGSPAPTYQWKKGGVNITGATAASYTINPVALTDAATYTVTASNASGNVTSSGAVLTVQAAPTITTQPSSLTVSEGASASFTVVATGTPAPTYQWKKGGVDIAGATAATYTIPATVLGDAGSYTVLLSNAAGTLLSAAATLTVNSSVVAPAITTQPVSQTVNAGASVTFTAAASGTPAPTYQWKKGGVDISGATSASYTIATVTAGDAASYTVVATNPGGSATSNPAVLTVQVAPVITTQPVSQTVNAGASVTFTAAASGTPAPTFQWKKGGVDISGATSASYTIPNVAVGDAASYTVVATNPAGSATSTPAVLTVQVAPAITTQPVSQTVNAGASVTFTAAASGTPAPTFQWKKGGVDISGATSASYTIANVAAGDAASYTVVVTNPAGSATSAAAVLTVQVAPSITTQPVSLTVVSGKSATFSVIATGTPAPTYQWKKGGADISGATGASLTIPSAVDADAGSYTVVVTNPAGSVTSVAATLTVSAAPVAPTITSQPVSQTVNAGGSVTFAVTASGNPTPTYQWKKGGVDISGATGASYTIASVAVGDAASYTVAVSNSEGSVVSNPAVLTVQVAPAITTQPAAVTVDEGVDATFTVAATGTPAPTYQWKFNGALISGATSSTLTVAKAKASDAGDYTVDVANAAGSITSAAAHLTVNPVGPLTVQLTNLLLDGQNLSFDVGCPVKSTCDIYSSDDLVTWKLEESIPAPADGMVHYTDVLPAGVTIRFFKAIVTR